MAELEYSNDALNVKGAFYRAKAMIYVEGDDDVLFWEEVFAKVSPVRFEVESVGGSSELDKLIAEIEAGLLDAIAARDADFLRFTTGIPRSNRVLLTVGHSIENSLYTADALYQIARSWCRSTAITKGQCEKWLTELARCFSPLVALEIANATSNGGVAVLGDNCTKFMTSQVSATPCVIRIGECQIHAEAHLPKSAVASAKKILTNTPTVAFEYIRGHVLATAVLKFLLQAAKGLGKKIAVSMDGLYASAITQFGRSFTAAHPHHGYYTSAAAAAGATFE